MKTISLIFWLLMLCDVIGVNGQNTQRSTKDTSAIKLMLTLEALNTNKMTIPEASFFLSKALIAFDTLESFGFPQFKFYSISTSIRSELKTDNPPIFGNNCPYYVIAIQKNGDLCFRVQGFYYNDSQMLFLNANRAIISKRKFLKNHRIEGIDLECHYDAWKANSFDTKKYSCMQYCLEPFITH